MTAERQSENTNFLQGKADDEQAIQLLEAAKAALMEFYEKNNINMNAAFVQKRNTSEVAPDTTFSGSGSRALESKGIIMILSHIIEDLQREVSQSVTAEEQAQLSYEKQMSAISKLLGD